MNSNSPAVGTKEWNQLGFRTAAHFEIRKFDYLKTPSFSVTYHNEHGGSFSNSGSKPSLKACAQHIYSTYREVFISNPATRVVIEKWTGFDENDQPVTVTDLTDLDALLSRTVGHISADDRGWFYRPKGQKTGKFSEHFRTLEECKRSIEGVTA